MSQLQEKLCDAIMRMADQVKATPDSLKAVHYSEAALNLMKAKSLCCGECPIQDDTQDETPRTRKAK